VNPSVNPSPGGKKARIQALNCDMLKGMKESNDAGTRRIYAIRGLRAMQDLANPGMAL
jgi:hypothetical protein